jgi:hypothetical protein
MYHVGGRMKDEGRRKAESGKRKAGREGNFKAGKPIGGVKAESGEAETFGRAGGAVGRPATTVVCPFLKPRVFPALTI